MCAPESPSHHSNRWLEFSSKGKWGKCTPVGKMKINCDHSSEEKTVKDRNDCRTEERETSVTEMRPFPFILHAVKLLGAT